MKVASAINSTRGYLLGRLAIHHGDRYPDYHLPPFPNFWYLTTLSVLSIGTNSNSSLNLIFAKVMPPTVLTTAFMVASGILRADLHYFTWLSYTLGCKDVVMTASLDMCIPYVSITSAVLCYQMSAKFELAYHNLSHRSCPSSYQTRPAHQIVEVLASSILPAICCGFRRQLQGKEKYNRLHQYVSWLQPSPS